MSGKKKESQMVSKTNVTARAGNKQEARHVVLVYESYRKSNGALGLRKHWEDV
jgi:hypothetical protein